MKKLVVKLLLLIISASIVFAMVSPTFSFAKEVVTVSFDTDGGTVIPAVVLNNESLAQANKIPEDPKKDGCTFMGWFPSKEFLSYQRYREYSFHEIYDDDITLYALFVPNDKVIKSLSINLEKPVVGDVVEVEFREDQGAWIEDASLRPDASVVGSNNPYDISYTVWLANYGENYQLFEGEFEEGKEYYASITLDIPENSEYKFDYNLQVTINGVPAVAMDYVEANWATAIAKVPSTTKKQDGGNPVQNDPAKDEEEENGIRIEAEDNTEVNNKATEAVKQLIVDIIDGKDVPGLSDELKEKITKAIDENKTISVEVTSPKVEKEEVAEDAKKIEEKLSGNEKIAALYDVDVLVKIDGEVVGTVTDTGEGIKIVLPIPDDLPDVPAGCTRIFKIFKVHNGVATELETTQDGDEVSAVSDEFSTYGLTYEDVKKTSNPSTGDHIIVWMGIMAVSVIGIVGTTKFRK